MKYLSFITLQLDAVNNEEESNDTFNVLVASHLTQY